MCKHKFQQMERKAVRGTGLARYTMKCVHCKTVKVWHFKKMKG
jgi:hypothetical protein